MRPIIGISTNFQTVESGKFVGMERIYLNRDYVDAVEKAGGIPILLPPTKDSESIEKMVAICNGFILSGGGDINPLLFNSSPHPKLEGIHTELDRAQISLTHTILETDKPLLAICRGAQLLNVALGGTLWQDMSEIPTPTILHSQIAPRADKIHQVHIVKNSITGQLFGEQITVNSFHHQSINTVGKDLQVIATADDGVIEAIEMTEHTFVLGIQWHPEMLLTASDESLLLFRKFIDIARK